LFNCVVFLFIFFFCRNQHGNVQIQFLEALAKKEKEEKLIQSQRGAIGKFAKNKTKVSSDNQSLDVESSTLVP
jgi:hypothetical protein